MLRNSKESIETFDSLGIDYDKESMLKQYCKFKVKNLIVNETPFQSLQTDSCGLYCVYFIINRYFKNKHIIEVN
jgi:hypothetical protein